MHSVVNAIFTLIWSHFTVTEYIKGDPHSIMYRIRRQSYFRELRNLNSNPLSAAVEKAVLCSQYFLRNFCRDFFLRVKESMVNHGNFKFCVYFLLDNWLRHRNDVFTKVIDCFAVIAEAVLYLDEEADISLKMKSAPELFCMYFKHNLASEFHQKGGWEQLETKASADYSYLYSILKVFLWAPKDSNIFFTSDQSLVNILRNSPVMFPVIYSKMMENFVEPLEDEKIHYIDFDMSNEIFEKYSNITSQVYFTVVYVRRDRSVINEFLMKSNPSEGDFLYVFVGGSEEGPVDSVEDNDQNPSAQEVEENIKNQSQISDDNT